MCFGVGENIGALVRRAWQNGYVSKKKKTRAKRGQQHAKALRKSASKAKGVKQDKDDLFGFMKGRFEIVGDIESPIPDWAYWRPEKNS
jgi:hypothetical protein